MDDLRIDLNCDVGEGYDSDAALMDFVSSANIACGFHAGDADTMRQTVDIAIEKGVSIGAHPGYADLENFGRTEMDLASYEIYDLISRQISKLNEIAIRAGGKLRHVKPHGALYNQAARNPELATVIANAVADLDDELLLFGLSGSVLIDAAKRRGLRTASEVFADRTYKRDGSLTPRTEPNALVTDEDQAIRQVLEIITNKCVTSADGIRFPITADTVCIHGDGAHAIQFAAAIRKRLLENGIRILPVHG